jgi:Alw26I/Eco31I/Esp3I family type II restriction m6 adenine DNA methyltransferase
MEHVKTALMNSPRADLERRFTGRFYTPPVIADRLAQQALSICPAPSALGDPFCGDGRLIVAWLRLASRSARRSLRQVILWDYDADAVRIARQRVEAELSALGWTNSVSVQAEPCDTFARVSQMLGRIDTVLTNPPWELLKPDSRDGLNDAGEFRDQLRVYAAGLGREFPGAMSAKGKAMTGYGVNLARAGAIASAMLSSEKGAVAIVLPSSIFGDQASAPFRSEFFSRLGVARLDWYPAEARLFDGVDQPFVTVVAVAGSETSSYLLTRFDKDLRVLDERTSSVSGDRVPAFNVAAQHENIVAELAVKHAPLGLLEVDMRYGLWLGRELDETRFADSLARGRGGVPFLKGRHVFPFEVARDNDWRIDPQKREIPITIRETRLAWRDVSRPNQRRRMHVALVPVGYVTGNSLGVGFFRYAPRDWIRVLLAVMNSMVFELQIRAYLATAHVSQGVLRRCSIPTQCFEDASIRERIMRLVDERITNGKELPRLEVTMARAYGLRKEQFGEVLEAFPKLTNAERTAHLQSECWA